MNKHRNQHELTYSLHCRKFSLSVLLAALISSLIPLAQAGDTVTVYCPVKTVSADLSTRLPADWWFTPTQGRLDDVRMQNIGGDRTLVCLYKAFAGEVAVMRKLPDDVRDCKADRKKLRFVCYR